MAAPTPVTYSTAYSNDYRMYLSVQPGTYDPVTNSTLMTVLMVAQVRNGQGAVSVPFTGYLNVTYRNSSGTLQTDTWNEDTSKNRICTDYYIAVRYSFVLYHTSTGVGTFTVAGSYGTLYQGGPDDMPMSTISSQTYTLLRAPSNLSLSRISDGTRITVQSSAVADATEAVVGYEYQYSTDNATWSSTYPLQSTYPFQAYFGPTSPIAVNPLIGYYFRARAYASYPGPWSPSGYSASLATVPSSPASISAVVDGASVLVSFSASALAGGTPITGYYVQYTRDGGASWSNPILAPAFSYTYSGLINGTYRFRAYATNAVGSSTPTSTSDRVINVVTNVPEIVSSEFSAYPIYSAPYGPNKIRIQWRKPLGDWDYLLLVRSTLGFPVTVDDGVPLLLVTPSQHDNLQFPLMDPEIKLNDYPLIDNQVYYYSVFVKGAGTSVWTKAATTMAMSVKNYNTTQMMYDSLPLPYKSSTYVTGLTDAPTEVNKDLVNFLNVFAAEYETFKASTENIRDRYDVARLDGRLVPLMLQQLGMAYETELGLAQGRRLLASFAKNTKQHGSVAGLASYITAFSGYNCSIGQPINLMLDVYDSSAEGSIGRWVSAGSGPTLSSISVIAAGPSFTPYIEVATATTPTNLQSGALAVTSGSAGIQIRCGIYTPKTDGVPVKGSTVYTFSAYTKSSVGTSRTVAAVINWYDRFGSYISQSIGSGVSDTNLGWTRTVVTATSPSGATFAVPELRVTSAATSEVHFFDAMQFEQGSSATTFAEARRVDITLLPNRTNLALNPQVSNGTTNWTAGAGVGITNVSNRIRALGTSTVGTTDLLMTSQNIPVSVGKTYSFSASFRSPTTVASGAYDSVGTPLIQAYPRITWLNSSGAVISSVSGEFKVPMWYGNSAFDEVSSVTGTAPTGAVTAKIGIYTTSTDNAAVAGVYPEVLVSKVLFEQASGKLPYFDGSLSTVNISETGYTTVLNPLDVSWESVNGVSYFYLNKSKVLQRLRAMIPDHLPAAAPWALFYK